MKIQCNVCDAAEANVLCCADEAALCWDCDQKVHAANKLASKHQRVPLSNSSSQMPLCDICKDTVGYFFCLEDRALLCRNCDVAIHNVNPLVSAHQRFLLTGVKVGAEGAESRPSSTPGNLNSPSNGKDFVQQACTAPRRTTPALPEAHYQPGRPEGLSSSRLTFSGGSATGSASQWSLDEFLTLSDPNPNFYITDNGNGSSKCDSGKLGGDSDNSQRAADAETESDDCIGQVPDSHCTVPQIPSPPTASGLYWPKTHQIFGGSSMFVPDFGSSPLRDSPNHHHQPRFRSSKRRRNF